MALVGSALLPAAFLGAPAAYAEPQTEAFKIVVHPTNTAASVARDFVANAFLKKTTRWNDGELIRPVDLRLDSRVRQRFSEVILKRPVSAVRNYWQQRIFAGRDTPPPMLESDEAVVAYVAKYPGAVGYVSQNAKLDSSVKLLSVQ